MFGAINALVEAGSASSGKGTPLKPQKFSIVKNPGEDPEVTLSVPKGVKVLNPTSMKITRTSGWQAAPVGEQEKARYTHSGGEDQLSFTFRIDATETTIDLHEKVLKDFYELGAPMQFTDEGNNPVKQPPVVRVFWGTKFCFLGVVTTCDLNVMIFDPDGAAKHAEVTLSLKGLAYDKKTKASLFLNPKK